MNGQFPNNQQFQQPQQQVAQQPQQSNLPTFFEVSDASLEDTKIKFHGFKNGEHRFRLLPAFAPDKIYSKVRLHWGYQDEDGKNKVIVCLKNSEQDQAECPICNVRNHIVSQIDTLKSSYQMTLEIQEQIKQLEEQAGNYKAKPTYLWNILTEEGEQKVLQLSWNGHDSLHELWKFWRKNNKIDIANPYYNYLIYVNRTGQKAKTRYHYQVLDGFTKQISFSALTNLDEIYLKKPLEQVREIVRLGYVPKPGQDPNDRNFTNMPENSQQPPQNNQNFGGQGYQQPQQVQQYQQPQTQQPVQQPQQVNFPPPEQTQQILNQNSHQFQQPPQNQPQAMQQPQQSWQHQSVPAQVLHNPGSSEYPVSVPGQSATQPPVQQQLNNHPPQNQPQVQPQEMNISERLNPTGQENLPPFYRAQQEMVSQLDKAPPQQQMQQPQQVQQYQQPQTQQPVQQPQQVNLSPSQSNEVADMMNAINGKV